MMVERTLATDVFLRYRNRFSRFSVDRRDKIWVTCKKKIQL